MMNAMMPMVVLSIVVFVVVGGCCPLRGAR